MLNHSEIENPDSQQQDEHYSFPVTDQSRAQVLVVEDNPQMTRMIAATLAPLYRVITACDGQDGLEQALALHPDLILCDVSMHRMRGEQLVTVILAQPDFDDVPNVVLLWRSVEHLR